MARIRTIKPEFPQSESVGAISREARLLFLQLFTVADDEGRARAASRMLASLLYPYDDDAPPLVEGWLDELECGGMIRRYVVDGSTYLEIVKWLDHQKIDKPSKSRLPAFVDVSRALAKPREVSSADLVSRTLDQDHSRRVAPARASKQIDLEEAIAAAPSPFDEFWRLYPRREGPNPKSPAEKRFAQLVKTGLDPAFLVVEVKKFAALDDTRKAVGSRFIPQAVTWLNQQRWSDHAAVAALSSIDGGTISIEDAVKQYASFRKWPRGVGPEPGLAGCKASAELLAAHGLRPDGGKLALAPMAFPDDDEPLEAA